MTLTDAQRKTIDYFGLEVVNKRECKAGEWILNGGGNLYLTTHASKLNCVVVARPAHAAKVAELERELANERDRCDVTDRTLRDTCDEVTKLQRQVRALGSELAPIRALKVGSAEWAYYQMAVGREVKTNENAMWCAADLRQYEPFTLHVEPEPEPSAADLAAAIEKVVVMWPELKDKAGLVEALKLAARVKRKESGDGR